MPRYFFDIADTEAHSNLNKADLPDRETARQYAIGIAQTVMRDKVFEGKPPKSFIKIMNEAGEITDVIHSESH